MPNCSAKGRSIEAFLHLEFSVVESAGDGRSGEGVDKFNLLKREREEGNGKTEKGE